VTEAEFEQLVTKIRPELIRIATRRCGRDQAEDAIQTAILHCWKDAGWKGADSATVSRWLRRLAAMRGRDELRSLGRLRDAQRNLAVLANKGCRHVQSKPNSDGEVTNK
jgi:DNA-directed RNA polymerase specialized sigma24 family protein